VLYEKDFFSQELKLMLSGYHYFQVIRVVRLGKQEFLCEMWFVISYFLLIGLLFLGCDPVQEIGNLHSCQQ